MIGSMAGVCPIHKIERLYMGTEDAVEPTCLKCVAAAQPKTGRPQTFDDPGEDFFHKGAEPKVQPVSSLPPKVVFGDRAPLTDYVKQAHDILSYAPMPHDVKQFKSLQKAIGILKSLMENQNG